MNRSVIIVAGGKGSRMGASIPKQFLLLKGKPILMHTIQHFSDFDPQIKIVVVLPLEHVESWKSLCGRFNFTIAHQIVEGGSERTLSVVNGLSAVPNEGCVAIHDGVRPLISTALIKRCFEHAEVKGNAVPSVKISESMRRIKVGRSKTVKREEYRLIQTPQCFKTKDLKAAYDKFANENFTDDASLFEADGHFIELIEGETKNIKITTPEELKMAELLLGS